MTTSQRRRLAYAVMIALNASVLIIGVLGVAWWRREQAVAIPARLEGTITGGFFEPAADVGYIPRANQQVTARRVTAAGVVYDVTYTIGADHFRIKPPACAALFGDSFTFDEGVNDDQTYPWQLAAGSDGRIQAYSFGIGGWGPHQMLAGLQSGRFQRAMTCPLTVVVYTMIGGHMRRLAGRDAWADGPRFRADSRGGIVRDGNLKDPGRVPPDDLDEGFLSWRRLLGVRRSGTPDDVVLTAAVFRESRRILAELAGRPPLHVIYWDIDTDARIRALLERFAADGVVVHRIEEVIPDFSHNRPIYEISKADSHPNPHAHRLVADYVAAKIIGSFQR